MKAADADKLTCPELMHFIQTNCTNKVLVTQARKTMQMLALSPSPSTAPRHADACTVTVSIQLARLFPPVTNETKFKTILQSTGGRDKRTLVLRGVLGGLTSWQLRVQCGIPGGTVNGASKCLKECQVSGSITPAKWWADNGGWTGRKRRLSSVDSHLKTSDA